MRTERCGACGAAAADPRVCYGQGPVLLSRFGRRGRRAPLPSGPPHWRVVSGSCAVAALDLVHRRVVLGGGGGGGIGRSGLALHFMPRPSAKVKGASDPGGGGGQNCGSHFFCNFPQFFGNFSQLDWTLPHRTPPPPPRPVL